MDKLVICLPTYNEKENIETIVRANFSQQIKLDNVDLNILVIDDSSPDGTADIVINLQKEFDKLHLITGKKEGLGKAYLRGFKHAIEELNADIIMEMDADFSHDPDDIPRMIDGFKDDVDFVIGSRYVKGGTIPDNWGVFRVLNSKIANIVARLLAGIKGVKDCTAGFRAIKTSLLNKIDLDSFTIYGYVFQLTLLDKALEQGAVVGEIPVHFIDRKYGETKMAFSDMFEFLMTCIGMRIKKLKTLIKFLIVGSSGVVVNLGFFTLFYNLLNVNKYIASPLAIELSIISNFLLNYIWTFKNKNEKDSFFKKGAKFNLVSLGSLAISYGTFTLLTKLYPTMIPQIAQLIGIVPATFVNFMINNYWTFKDTESADK